MGEKIVLGEFNKGLRTDRPGFMIDNDSFPTLINAYQWRGRVKRKRGTSLLGRLQYFFETGSIGNTSASIWNFNLFTVSGVISPNVAQPNASIVPGSVQIFINPTTITGTLVSSNIPSPPSAYTIASDCQVFVNSTAGLNTGDQVTISGVVVVPNTGPALINNTWNHIEVVTTSVSFKLGVPSNGSGSLPRFGNWQSAGTYTKTVGGISFKDDGNGNLTSTTGGNSGTINYVTGAIALTHTAGAGIPTDATFSYYPTLPVMGLEDFEYSSTQFPGTIAFDTAYAYNITPTKPNTIYNVNYYKNPAIDANNLPNYVPKVAANQAAFNWNGQNYQQFWTTNYQNSMWVTNGINIPFPVGNALGQNLGMQFKAITGVTIGANGNGQTVANGNVPAVATLNIAANGLVIGDFIFVNEVVGITGINYQTGYVTARNTNSITVTFPFAILGGAYTSGGIAQYLTNTANPAYDCIRWYDGDPTINSGVEGWVNFSPPLSQFLYNIAELPLGEYYLIGARMILPFKDRLIFIGPVVQTSTAGSQVYLQDTVIYSQNGTPYYTASSSTINGGTSATYLLLPTTIFYPILVPENQTATANSYFEDSAGFGGFASAALNQPINTTSIDQDNLIMGFTTKQARFVYTGNDVNPFEFYLINSELGSGSTFSAITTDSGVLARGTRGYTLTSQTNCQRFDLDIPDQVFQIDLTMNGNERFTAIRDFVNEWIFFTYPANNSNNVFPNQTLMFNYRDNSFGIFNESYTTYGTFRLATGDTWLTWPDTWDTWNQPWNAGGSTLLNPQIIAGNQQGFVMIRQDSITLEAPSLEIDNIVGNQVTSTNHCLNTGDYIIITGVATNGTVAPQVNGIIFQIQIVDQNNFTLSPGIVGGTYVGGGMITRMYIPFIQTKQFPTAWGTARKTRLGPQQYLMTSTANAQITLLIYLSQDSSNAWNNSAVIPAVPPPDVFNSSLIQSTVLYTCPESTNLGLTPSNSNLLNLTEVGANNIINQQAQIWHRMNTSLIGDTVQIGFTLSPAQMTTLDTNGNFVSQFAEIEINGLILDVQPSSFLA